MKAFCDALNGVEWDQRGFVCDGRFLFSQRSLENAPLPESFQKFLPKSGRGITSAANSPQMAGV
jgi:adenine-specific DNA-methyltransferase